MKQHLRPVGNTDNWITPQYITKALGTFDLDPCAHTEMPWQHANNQFTVKEDGLKQQWDGRIWLNPPFSATLRASFMQKMNLHKNGIALLPATFETKPFKQYVINDCKGILMLDHRPYFHLPSGERGKSNSGQTMCLVAFDEMNLESLLNSGLGHVFKPYHKNYNY